MHNLKWGMKKEKKKIESFDEEEANLLTVGLHPRPRMIRVNSRFIELKDEHLQPGIDK